MSPNALGRLAIFGTRALKTAGGERVNESLLQGMTGQYYAWQTDGVINNTLPLFREGFSIMGLPHSDCNNSDMLDWRSLQLMVRNFYDTAIV